LNLQEKSVGYLGPAGTFTQQAAQNLCGESPLRPMTDIGDVFRAVATGECAAGVVPIENSTEGAVNATLDALLREEAVQIATLLMLPIRHALMGRDSGAGIQKILAHPQALAQCRAYLRRHFPEAEAVPCASNAEGAARVAASDKPWAAIGPVEAAAEYGLHVWAEGIQDQAVNRTSFVLIRNAAETAPLPHCRTSLVFSTQNRPGALYQVLGYFQRYGINMTKILSRPLPEQPGAYIFFVDIEDYRPQDAALALERLRSEAMRYRFLGSYPVVSR